MIESSHNILQSNMKSALTALAISLVFVAPVLASEGKGGDDSKGGQDQVQLQGQAQGQLQGQEQNANALSLQGQAQGLNNENDISNRASGGTGIGLGLGFSGSSSDANGLGLSFSNSEGGSAINHIKTDIQNSIKVNSFSNAENLTNVNSLGLSNSVNTNFNQQ